MGQTLGQFLSSHVRMISILIAVVVVFQAFVATGITKNTSPYFISSEHETRKQESLSKEVFSRTGDTVLILLKFENTDVFNNDVVSLVRRISDDVRTISVAELIDSSALAKLDGFNEVSARNMLADRDSAIEAYNKLQQKIAPEQLRSAMGEYLFPVRSVKSLINTDNIVSVDDELFIESSYFEQENNQWLAGTKQQVLDNPLLTGAFVSLSGDSLTVHAELNVHEENAAANRLVVTKIKAIIDAQVMAVSDKLTVSAHYAGVPLINDAMSDVMEADNALYFPFVILFVFVLLLCSFRSVRAAVYCLTIAVASIIVTLGLMPMLGITLNIVTTILPVFIITIAVTDAIHVLSDADSNADPGGNEAVHRTLKKLFRPMLITSLTTAVGFFSLAFTDITNIRAFGIMVGLSVIIAFILSVTLLPILQMRWPIRPQHKAPQDKMWLLRVSRSLSESNVYAWLVIILTIVIAAWGLPKVRVDQASIKSFDPDTTVRIDNEVMTAQGLGSIPVSIWFRGPDAETIIAADMLKLIRRLDTLLLDHPDVADSVSLVGFLERMHLVLEDDGSKLNLNDKERIRQYLLLLEGSVERDLEALVDVGPYTQTRIIVSMKNDSSATISALFTQLDSIIYPMLPTGIERLYTSYGASTVSAADEVVTAQKNSMLLSVGLIFLIICAVFRSFLTGLISILPLCMTLLMMFGMMGIFGFPIDIGSSVIAGIAFGIGIDYSIHFIEAVKRTSQPDNPIDGLQQTLKQVFTPIFVSAIVISSGFSLLLLSSFQPIANLGLLITVTMLMSALFSLVILPKILLLKSGFLYKIVVREPFKAKVSSCGLQS